MSIKMVGLLDNTNIITVEGDTLNDIKNQMLEIFPPNVQIKFDHRADTRYTALVSMDDEFLEGIALFIEDRQGFQSPAEMFELLLGRGTNEKED